MLAALLNNQTVAAVAGGGASPGAGYVKWRDSELYRAFLLAVTTYDAGPPYPAGLHPEVAQWFLNYLRRYGG